MKYVLSVILALCLSQFAQAQYDAPIYTPGQFASGNTQTVVANQTVMPNGMPGMPPIHMWNQGVREEWKTIHEIRPVRDYDGYGYNGYNGYNGRQDFRYPASDGWYMNPATNNYQRNCAPSYQPACQQTPIGGGRYTVAPQQGNGYMMPQQPGCGYPSYPNYQRQGWWR